MTPPGRAQHGFTFNAVDDLASYEPPRVSGVSWPTLYTSDRDHELVLITKPDGEVIEYIRDVTTGQLTSRSDRFGMLSVAHDTQGRLHSLTTAEGQVTTLGYDGAMLTSEAQSGVVTGTVSFTHDTHLRLSTETAAGHSVAYGYNADSLVTSAGDLTITRNSANGRVTSTTLGIITTSNATNAFGEPERYAASDAGGEIFRDIYFNVFPPLDDLWNRGGGTTGCDYGACFVWVNPDITSALGFTPEETLAHELGHNWDYYTTGNQIREHTTPADWFDSMTSHP